MSEPAKAGDLVDRLRGKYTVPINDGAGPLDGKTEMTRDFSAFIPPINLEAAAEIEFLRRWRTEQLTVTAWWQTIDDYVRKHRDITLGDSVSAFALRLLKEGDAARESIALLEKDILPYWRAALNAARDHTAVGGEARASIEDVIKHIDMLLAPDLAAKISSPSQS